MYVCQCKAVTDRQVRGAMAEGCTTLRSVAAATGAGTACGGCIGTIRDLVCGTCPSRVVDVACDDAVTPVTAAIDVPAMRSSLRVTAPAHQHVPVGQPA